MQTQIPAQQAQQNQSRTEHKSQESTQLQFEDARPEATAQMRLQSLMANGAHSTQLKSMQAMMNASTPLRDLGQSPGATNPIPMQRMEDEEPLQAKTDEPVQREQTEVPPETPPPKPNNTGLPDNLKAGIENLSGISMDHVKVHYNSDKPAQLQAHAYAQGSDIHVAPGQEKHLPHEARHVVQQAQGRVRSTMQMKGNLQVNDDEGLEREADIIGAEAFQFEDNRPEAIAQRKLQEVVNKSQNIQLPQKKTIELISNESYIEPKLAVNTIDSTNKSNTIIAQRVIDFSKKSSTVPVSNMDGLIDFFVKKYGQSNEKFIRDKIDEINNKEESWSVYDVYRSFLSDDLPVYEDVEFSHHSSSVTLPGGGLSDKERYAAINQFSFNTVTRLVGIVGKKRFETRNDSSGDLHAEEIFMNQVESSGIPLDENTVIKITINNSPCHAKCANLLASWVKKHKLKKVTIFFANPYGTDEEFTNVIEILKAAGIRIHGFVPLNEVGSDTDEEIEEGYRDRFKKMENRLKHAKGKNLYISDESSSSSDDDSIYSEEEKITFKEWMKVIVILAWTEYGLNLEDLPDEMFMVGYEDGYSPVEFYEERMSKGKSAGPFAQGFNIEGEGELEPVIINSVAEFLQSHGVHPSSNIFVVSGENWECYIRCVLHHFGKIDLLSTVIEKLKGKGVDIGNGVTIGASQEDDIRSILAEYVGEFHVTATDYNQNIIEDSATNEGTKVRIILTGAHFSLLR